MKLHTFLRKSVEHKNNPTLWFKKNKEYLSKFDGVSAIISSVENNDVLPTPAFINVIEILSAHLFAEMQKELNKPKNLRAPSTDKRYSIDLMTIDKNGHEVKVDLSVSSFVNFQDAENFVIRRLAEDYCGSRAIIHGCGVSTEITRDVAIARSWGNRKMMQVCKKTSPSGGLGFGVKVKQDMSSFSRG